MITPQHFAPRALRSLLIATGFLAAVCQATPIICDTFTRSGGISGSAADTGQIWSGSGWTTNGTELGISGGSNASVISGLTFLPNTTYVLTMDVSVTSGGGPWIGFGFTTAGGNPASNSRGFMLHKGNQVVEFFTSGTGGVQTQASPSPFPNTLEIQLDTGTTLANSTLTYRLNGVAVGNPVTTNASTIDAVFIQSIDNSVGSVDNFVLRESSPLQAYLKATYPNDVDQFGHAVAVSGDTAVVGAYYEDSAASGVNGDETDNSLTNSGAVFVFVRDGSGNWTQQAYLKASTPGENDNFGISVDIDGDTIIVGAHSEDSNATGVNGDASNNLKSASGAAYIFTRVGPTWTQQAYLKATNTDSGDNFGWSVAISGDTAVVGAPLEDSNATGVGGDQTNNGLSQAGAAYVFTKVGPGWFQTSYLKASNTDAGDRFGWAVDVESGTFIVGAKGESSANGVTTNNDAQDSGAAYIFSGDTFLVSEDEYLKASNIGAGDLFGHSVAIDQGKVIVGAPQEDSGAGAAYVFDGNLAWAEQAYLKAPNAAAGDQFGYSVGISTCAVAVGAPGEDSSASGMGGDQSDNTTNAAGAVYLFQDDSNNWSFQEYLKASNTGSNDVFGVSLSLDNGILLVGAQGEDSGDAGDPDDNSSPTSGAAYTFDLEAEIAVTLPVDIDLTSGSSALWHGNELVGGSGNSKTLAVCNTGLGPLTDISVSITGSHPGDFVVDDSALNSTLGPCECGSLTVTFSPTAEGVRNATLLIYSNDKDECPFEIELNGIGAPAACDIADTLVEVDKVVGNARGEGDRFGQAVSMYEDTAVVGAPFDDLDGEDVGLVIVYRLVGGNWILDQGLRSPDPATVTRFGHAVHISGNRLIVGARGRAYIFERLDSSSIFSFVSTLSDADGGAGFGESVAISWGDAVVGIPRDDENGTTSGSALAFSRISAQGNVFWFPRNAKILPSDGDIADQFGFSVSLSGDNLIVGAPDEGAGGSAYIFKKDNTAASGFLQQPNKLVASNGGTGDKFGHSVCISGTTAVVGAFGHGSPNSGSAYVFKPTVGVWGQDQIISGDSGSISFGISVSLAGNTMIVGDDLEGATGHAYRFIRDSSADPFVWNQPKISPSDGGLLDHFGAAVATSGGHFLVGALFDDEQGDDSGSAYFFNFITHEEGTLALYDEAAAVAGLTGSDALPDATPFDDGVPNLLKYAFDMNLEGPDVTSLSLGGNSGLPWGEIVELAGQKVWRYEYVRRVDCDLFYTALKSPDLMNSWVPFTGTMTMTPISTGWTRMTLEEPYDPIGKRYFYRVEVELP